MRAYNFSAGPAILPEEVLKEAAAELVDYQGTGMSIMEMSHRGKEFISIYEQAEADLRLRDQRIENNERRISEIETRIGKL